jgi:hypothetical protein
MSRFLGDVGIPCPVAVRWPTGEHARASRHTGCGNSGFGGAARFSDALTILCSTETLAPEVLYQIFRTLQIATNLESLNCAALVLSLTRRFGSLRLL